MIIRTRGCRRFGEKGVPRKSLPGGLSMRILISPAKKMRTDPDTLPWETMPAFLHEAETLWRCMQAMEDQALQALWRCSDAIAAQNTKRLRTLNLRRRLTPAILAYDGIQYRYMAPGVFDSGQYAYAREHLRILSGLYGLLRPFDGVVPYRLEMQAKLHAEGCRDLYAYWGDKPARALAAETGCILNLASQEYSRAVERHLPAGMRMITCIFGQRIGGKIVEKGTLCKMARGEMVRFLAERDGGPETAQAFSGLGYRYAPLESTPERYVFLQEEVR